MMGKESPDTLLSPHLDGGPLVFLTGEMPPPLEENGVSHDSSCVAPHNQPPVDGQVHGQVQHQEQGMEQRTEQVRDWLANGGAGTHPGESRPSIANRRGSVFPTASSFPEDDHQNQCCFTILFRCVKHQTDLSERMSSRIDVFSPPLSHCGQGPGSAPSRATAGPQAEP